MSDYIVTFNQNGSPTIIHGFKYFQKIKNGLKTRYFYSKAEWDAYQRNLSSDTRSITGGHGNDKVQTGTNPSPSNRPAGHSKNKTGEAKPGSVYKRGKGLNSSTPATSSTGYVPKTKKEKEYAEAVNALADYKKKQFEAKAAKNRFKENLAITAALGRIKYDPSSKEDRRRIEYTQADSRRDTKNSFNYSVKLTGEQIKAARKFFKETADFAIEAIKDGSSKKAEKVVDRCKSIHFSDVDKFFSLKN